MALQWIQNTCSLFLCTKKRKKCKWAINSFYIWHKNKLPMIVIWHCELTRLMTTYNIGVNTYAEGDEDLPIFMNKSEEYESFHIAVRCSASSTFFYRSYYFYRNPEGLKSSKQNWNCAVCKLVAIKSECAEWLHYFGCLFSCFCSCGDITFK